MTTFMHKRDNGIFYVIIRYTDVFGQKKDKWVSTGCKNENDAKKKYGDIVRSYSYLDSGVDSDISVSEYLRRWKERQKQYVRQSTFESYYTYFEKHLIPFFEKSKIRLRDIKARDIQNFVNHLTYEGKINGEGGLSTITVRKIFGLLKSALKDAVVEEYIDVNPALNVTIRKRTDENYEQQKNCIKTVTEAQRLIRAFEGHYLQPLIIVTLFFGLRRSEVLGLRWQSVDFEKNTITINNTVVKNRTIIVAEKTKTKSSHRVLEMNDYIKNILLELKKKQEADQLYYGNSYYINDYVFKNEIGAPFRPDTVTRVFEKQIEKNGFPHMRFHDLRHSTSSILCSLNWSAEQRMNWLGHSTIKTTVDTYTEYSRDLAVKASSDLSILFSTSSSGNE